MADTVLVTKRRLPFFLNSRYQENKERSSNPLLNPDGSDTLERHYAHMESYFTLIDKGVIQPFPESLYLEIEETLGTLLSITNPPAPADLGKWAKNMERLYQKHKEKMVPNCLLLIKHMIHLATMGPWNASPAGSSLEKFTRVDCEISSEDCSKITSLFEKTEECVIAGFRLLSLRHVFLEKVDKMEKYKANKKISRFVQSAMAHEKISSIPWWRRTACTVVMGVKSWEKEAYKEILRKVDLSTLYEMIAKGAFSKKRGKLLRLVVWRFYEEDFKTKDTQSKIKCLDEFLSVVGRAFDQETFLDSLYYFLPKDGDPRGPDAVTSWALSLKILDMELTSASFRTLTAMCKRTLVLAKYLRLKIQVLDLLMTLYPKSRVGRAFSVARFILSPCAKSYTKVVTHCYTQYNKNDDKATEAKLNSKIREFAYSYALDCLREQLELTGQMWDMYYQASNFVDFLKVKFFCFEFVTKHLRFTKVQIQTLEDAEDKEIKRLDKLPKYVAPKEPANPEHEKHFQTLPYNDRLDIVQFISKQTIDLRRELVRKFYCVETDCSCEKCTGIKEVVVEGGAEEDDSDDDTMWDDLTDKQVKVKLRHQKDAILCGEVDCEYVGHDEESFREHFKGNHDCSNGHVGWILSSSSRSSENQHHYRHRSTPAQASFITDDVEALLSQSVGEVELCMRGMMQGLQSAQSSEESSEDEDMEEGEDIDEDEDMEEEADVQRSAVDCGEMDNSETVDPNVPASREVPQEAEEVETPAKVLNGGQSQNGEDNGDNSASDPIAVELQNGDHNNDSDFWSDNSVTGFSDDEGNAPIRILKAGRHDMKEIYAKIDGVRKCAKCPLCLEEAPVFDSEEQFNKHIRKSHCDSAYLKNMPSFSACCSKSKWTSTSCTQCKGIICYHKTQIPVVERVRKNVFDVLHGLIDEKDTNIPTFQDGQVPSLSVDERKSFSEQMYQQCRLLDNAGLAPCEVFLSRTLDGKWKILVSGYYKLAPFYRKLVKDGMSSDEQVKWLNPHLYTTLHIAYALQYNEGNCGYKIKSDVRNCLAATDLPSLVHYFTRHIVIPSSYNKVPGERFKYLKVKTLRSLKPLSLAECFELCPDKIELVRDSNTRETWLDFKSTRAMLSKSFSSFPPPREFNFRTKPEEDRINLTGQQNVAGLVDTESAPVLVDEDVEKTEWCHHSYQTQRANVLYKQLLKSYEEHSEGEENAPPVISVARKPRGRPRKSDNSTAGQRGRPRKKPATPSTSNRPTAKVVNGSKGSDKNQPPQVVSTRRSGRINARKEAECAPATGSASQLEAASSSGIKRSADQGPSSPPWKKNPRLNNADNPHYKECLEDKLKPTAKKIEADKSLDLMEG